LIEYSIDLFDLSLYDPSKVDASLRHPLPTIVSSKLECPSSSTKHTAPPQHLQQKSSSSSDSLVTSSLLDDDLDSGCLTDCHVVIDDDSDLDPTFKSNTSHPIPQKVTRLSPRTSVKRSTQNKRQRTTAGHQSVPASISSKKLPSRTSDRHMNSSSSSSASPIKRVIPQTPVVGSSSSLITPRLQTNSSQQKKEAPRTTRKPIEKRTIVLFGDAGLRPHSFGRVRGGKGCRGPVKEIQKRLSKRVLVIAVSEFRTSKCCRGCGSVLLHPNNDDRTSYCKTDKSKETWNICRGQRNRDLDAAWKIGARFLALKTGRELGAFDENLHADNIPSASKPPLCDVVADYQRQFFDLS